MTRREAFAAVPLAVLELVGLATREPEPTPPDDMTADELEELAATLLTEANKRRKE